MPGPLERWLETFMCGQFAEHFERYGYRTLQTVCQLQLPQLLSIGIPHKESEIILQNIQILCQSTATVAQQQTQHGMRSNYGNRMTQEVHGTSFQDRDTLQQHMNYMVPDSSCYNYGSPSSGMGGHFYSQCMPQSPDPAMINSAYRQQQYQGSSSFPAQQPPDRTQYPNTNMTSTSNAVVTSRHNYQGHVPGSPLIGQTNMHQSHPHLRNSGQTPQEVANNILHMAAASYPTNHTVQVPLSKNRSAPYHVPSRSPNYNTQLQENQQMCSDYSHGQFVYPSPPHQSQQHQSRDPRLSPISPASASMISSPHSHHSGRSIPSSSPCSLHSPGIGHVRSPGPNSQMMNSPQRGQYPMSSLINPPGQRLMSPVPTNQQLQVSVPSSISQSFQHCYMGNMLNSSQHPPYQQQFISQFSPTALAQNSQYGQSSQFCNSSGVPTGHFGNSPGGQSGHFSNISSPYTPGSRTYPSPPQSHDSPSAPRSVSDTNLTHTSDIKECNSPLESLQKLCMLPESQVVDPKTVVKEAIPSPNNLVVKPFESCSNSSDFICAKTTSASTDTSSVSESVSSRKDNELSKGPFESVVSPEMKFQPKKMMLLRAAKEDFSTTSQGDISVQSGCGQSEAEPGTDHNTDQQTVSEQNAAKNESHLTEGSVVETISDDRIVSDNISPENSDEVIPTDSSDNQKNSNDQGSVDSYYDDSVKDRSYEHADHHNTSNDLTLDVVESIVQDINTVQSSSQNTEEGDADSKSPAGIIDSVQSPVRDVEEEVQSKDVQLAYVSDSSVSDNEPQLVVRKDTKSTYSKQERLKSFEITPRIRADSTGSLSENSEFEYEDHIGCDDIETGFTDIDEKSNEVIEESVDDTKDLSSNISDSSMVIDRVMITGSHWKKNGVNNKARKNRKNGHLTPIRVIRQMSELDLDYVPSPLGGDVVDGPVGVDNGDGTVTVSRPSRMRQRKTPVKYKDTSFFQGDFVFIEEEEDYLQQMEPKKKIAKRIVDISCHNTNKNGIVKTGDKLSKSAEKHIVNNKLLKEKKPKQSMKTKAPKLEATVSKHLQNTLTLPAESAKQNCEQTETEYNIAKLKLITKGDNGHMKSVKMVSVPDELKLVKDITTKPEVPSISPVPKSKSDSKPTPSEILIDKAAVTRKASSKQEVSVEKSGSIKTVAANRQLNGVKTRSINCGAKTKNNRTGENNPVVSQNKGKLAKANKSKTVIADETNSDDNYEVIEINSEDSNGADNVSGANNNVEKLKKARVPMTEVGSLAMECEDIVSDEEQSQRRGFMFSLVEDEIVDENIIVGGAETDLTGDVIEIDDQTEIDDETKPSIKEHAIKRPSSASNIKGKNASTKISKVRNNGKSSKRKSFIEDPDFDFGPSKKDILSTRKSNKRPDKWANFKGPKVIFDGVKDTPNNCLVINDPFEQQTISKRAKLISQNVTRIEISQLPSDKSVLIPYTETSENDEWTCALCGKHSSYKFLGDLFGPYTVETMSEDMLDLSPKVWLGTKRRRSDEIQLGTIKGSRSGKRAGSISREVNEWKEVWVHESCSVYSDGVFLIGSKIYGLQEAVRIASQTPCSLCHKLGAMIGCLNKGCQQKFHHVCAQEADCYLDEENFSLLCPKHKIKKLKQLEACTSTNVASTSSSID